MYTIFVKRLVALPGDTVEITDGHLYVNGELVPDPEKMGSVPRDYAKRTLGEDEYFVVGDNRYNSHDSRDWNGPGVEGEGGNDGNTANNVGPISKSMIVGRVREVIWPLGKIRGVN